MADRLDRIVTSKPVELYAEVMLAVLLAMPIAFFVWLVIQYAQGKM